MKKYSLPIILIGIVVTALAVEMLALTFYPAVSQEIRYRSSLLSEKKKIEEIVPVDRDFGIVIAKIGANSKVISLVDPYNNQEYQRALAKGVAHAKGTSFPGQPGNIFIFSHSSVNLFEAGRYNSVFYLLSKMEKGDEVVLFYEKKPYTYQVTGKKVVSKDDVSYLSGKSSEPTLTLMTCWPPGTTLKRLIVEAVLLSQ